MGTINQVCHCFVYNMLHCETFWSSASERFNITKSCKEIEDKIEIRVQAAIAKDSNMTIICCEFLAVKKIK